MTIAELKERIGRIHSNITYPADGIKADPMSDKDMEAALWNLFLQVCFPSYDPANNRTEPKQEESVVSRSTPDRIALAFLTSGSIVNDEAWCRLIEECPEFSSNFVVLRHDDKDASMGGFWEQSGAIRVDPVPTARGTVSLVEAERRLLEVALEQGAGRIVLLSGHCLPLRTLDQVREAILAGGSFWQYHFAQSGFQRLFDIAYGALQWKVYHRREAELVVQLPKSEMSRFDSMAVEMSRYNLAPDEALITNYLSTVTNIDTNVVRKTPTYCEWGDSEDGLRHARSFTAVPEAAWQEAKISPFLLFVRKVELADTDAWWVRLQETNQDCRENP